MQLQVKLEKTVEITYLLANKQQTRVPPKIFRCFAIKKKLGLGFLRPKDIKNW